MIGKRYALVLVLILALVAALVSIAAAAPGDLDPSFGIGGKVTTDVGSSDQGDSAVLQSNGKIVVGGSTGPSGTAAADFALAKFSRMVRSSRRA